MQCHRGAGIRPRRVARTLSSPPVSCPTRLASGEMTDLLSLIDGPMCEVLNADVAHPLRHALSEECRDDANLALKSDVDPGAPR